MPHNFLHKTVEIDLAENIRPSQIILLLENLTFKVDDIVPKQLITSNSTFWMFC